MPRDERDEDDRPTAKRDRHERQTAKRDEDEGPSAKRDEHDRPTAERDEDLRPVPKRDRRELDAVFGDVLPDTTADERDPESSGSDREAWYRENRPPHHDR